MYQFRKLVRRGTNTPLRISEIIYRCSKRHFNEVTLTLKGNATSVIRSKTILLLVDPLCNVMVKLQANACLFVPLTYCMVRSPFWEANSFAASQEIPRISRNPKVHYRTHKRPPPVSIHRQLDPVHTTTSYFLKIYHNIIIPSTPGSPKWSLTLRFSHQNTTYPSPLPHTRYMSRPSHSSRFYQPSNIGWRLQF